MVNADFDLELPSGLFEPSGQNKGVPSLELSLDKLVSFKDHPYELKKGKKLNDLVECIKEYGVWQPIVVRPKDITDDETLYEILIGHNRVNAARIAGLEKIPAKIIDGLTEEEALVYVNESNLLQRSFGEMSHSERALTITTYHEVIKKQGRKSDLIQEVENLLEASNDGDSETSSPMGNNQTSMDKTGQEYALSKNSIARYLRVHKLIEPLKKRLDDDEFGVRAAVELSYLKDEEQHTVHDVLENPKYVLDTKKAELLRQASKKNPLAHEMVIQIFSGKKIRKEAKVSKHPYPTSFKLRPEVVLKHFAPGMEKQEIEDTIEEALDFFFKERNKSKKSTNG